MVGREGFEPSKAEPTDLQSVPFDRSGIPPEEPAILQINATTVNTHRLFFVVISKQNALRYRKAFFQPAIRQTAKGISPIT